MDEFKKQYISKDLAELCMFKIHNIGFQRCSALHTFSGTKDFYVIHYIVSGKGNYTVNGNTFELSSGDTFMISPHTIVSYTADNDHPWEYYWLGISGVEAKKLLLLTDFSLEKPYLHFNVQCNLENLILDIFSAQGNTYSDKVRMIGLSYVFLAEIIRVSKIQQGDIGDNYAEKAKEFIDLNYPQSISVELIASQLNISRSHLYRIFTNKFEISPNKYINMVRMEKACFLVQNSALTMNEISKSVGLENYFYFSNVFKKFTGHCPTMYKKKASCLDSTQVLPNSI